VLKGNRKKKGEQIYKLEARFPKDSQAALKEEAKAKPLV
jgi:hypothetical protein